MAHDLNPCGFCRSEAVHLHHAMSDDRSEGLFMAQVRCSVCGASGGRIYGDDVDIERDAVLIWNQICQRPNTPIEIIGRLNVNIFSLLMMTYIAAITFDAPALSRAAGYAMAGSFLAGVVMAGIISWRHWRTTSDSNSLTRSST
ncbi:Lar family restriction alleviation protein [Loktanella sp. DJP18]|uniref:Lar family restriction alleviation protein n=1 Tax=Loktanella sp. DJP18 TaxID=3409788 RepID=UPI003BB48A32